MAHVRCDACDALWDGANARWCGRCGAPLSASATTDGQRERRRRHRKIAVGVALCLSTVFAATVVTGDWGRPATMPVRSERGNETVFPAPVGRIAAAVAAAPPVVLSDIPRITTAQPGPGEVCAPDGCLRWMLPDVDRWGAIAQRSGLIVHLVHGDLVAIDGFRGTSEWRRLHQPPEGTGPEPSLFHLAQDELFVGYGHHVVRHDLGTGAERVVEVDFAPLRATHVLDAGEVALVGGMRLGVGQAWGVAAIDRNGSTRWALTDLRAPPVLLRDDGVRAVLAAPDGGGLTALDGDTGEVRWTRPEGTSLVDGSGPVLLVDPDGERVEAIDLADGRTRWELEGGGPVDDAWRVGPWLALSLGETVRVHEVDAGDLLFERPASRPPTPDARSRSAGVRWGNGAAIAWPLPETGQVELTRYDASGTVLRRQLVTPDVDDRCCIDLADAGEGLMRLSVGRGRYLAWVNGQELNVRRERRAEMTERLNTVEEHDGVVLLYEAGALTQPETRLLSMIGEADRINVRGPGLVVSTDPLVYLGRDGLVGLNRGLIR